MFLFQSFYTFNFYGQCAAYTGFFLHTVFQLCDYLSCLLKGKTVLNQYHHTYFTCQKSRKKVKQTITVTVQVPPRDQFNRQSVEGLDQSEFDPQKPCLTMRS